MAEGSLRRRRQALLDRTDLQGGRFCRAYASEVDAWLSALADRASGSRPKDLALLAVGGYGRGELCPYSDLDLVLVHKGRRDVAQVADAIWYPVWDEGVRLDHSVRRPAEVLQAADDDLRVALGLVDARLVWGDARVAGPLLADIVEQWRSHLGARWLGPIAEQMAERHAHHGDVAFLLEPDLKESHGGLRDVNVLRAVAACAPLLADHADLGALGPAAELLTRVRVELHRSAGRELSRLVLQEQDHIASVLGYHDADDLMAAVSEAGRTIAWVTDDAWRRRPLWQPTPSRGKASRRARTPGPPGLPPSDPAARNGVDREVEPGVCVSGGEVALTAGAPVRDDPSLGLRLAAVAAELDLPVARGALHRLADQAPPPPEPWPEGTRSALVRVLGAGHPAIRALESLDREDLLTQVIPEWKAVRNKPQRNAYHRFTVDRHLLETAANAAALVDRVERPDLLLVGSLLHDIGKGFPGDHTNVGIDLVGTIGGRMGFAPPDVATLQAMVRYHLLLPETATRRDIDDPATIGTVARAAGDRDTLELLAALTEADSLATGTSAWGTWKAGLVAGLTDRAARYLEGRELAGPGGWVTDLHRRLMAEVRAGGRPAVMLDPPKVVVAAPDHPGMLSAVAGTLALHGLDVRSADASSESGVAVEIFTVDDGSPPWPEIARLREDLDAALSDRLPLRDRLEARARDYARSPRLRSAQPLMPGITVDNEASASSTVVEVRAPDNVGLLHRVTGALFDCELDVVSARVATIGIEVIDAFYVRDASGSKVTDPDALRRIREVVQAAVA